MNGAELVRGVDLIHREKNIPRELIFNAIESAVQLATEKHFGEDLEIQVTIDRDSGQIHAQRGAEPIDPEKLGRIAAQAAKQAMIQKLREGECNAVFDVFAAKKGDLVHGTVQRLEGAPPRSPSIVRRPCCPVANKFPEKRTTSGSASRPSSSTCARSAIA